VGIGEAVAAGITVALRVAVVSPSSERLILSVSLALLLDAFVSCDEATKEGTTVEAEAVAVVKVSSMIDPSVEV
jgi:hypothetical protein